MCPTMLLTWIPVSKVANSLSPTRNHIQWLPEYSEHGHLGKGRTMCGYTLSFTLCKYLLCKYCRSQNIIFRYGVEMLLVCHSFTQACWMVFVVTGKHTWGRKADICQQPPFPSVVPYPVELLTHWKQITSEVCITLLLLWSLKSCISFSVWLKYSTRVVVVVVVLSLHHMFPEVLPAASLFQRSLVCQRGYKCHSKPYAGGIVCNLWHHLPWQNTLLK